MTVATTKPTGKTGAATTMKLLKLLTALPVVLLLVAIWTVTFPLAVLFGKVTLKNKMLIVFYPMCVYDGCALVFWGLNQVISAVCKYLAKDVPAKSKNKCDRQAVADALLARRRDIVFKEEQVVELFDSLPAATTANMLHNFHGTVVHTGSMLDVADDLIGSVSQVGINWGKRYRSKTIGDPLLINLFNKVFIPAPIWGNVGIPCVEYRGVTTATMVYDHQPWMDYFRVLRPETATAPAVYLGVWCSRDKIGGWFTLTGNSELDEATSAVHLHRD